MGRKEVDLFNYKVINKSTRHTPGSSKQRLNREARVACLGQGPGLNVLITDWMDMSLGKLWELVMDGGPGTLRFMGSQKVGHD